MFGKANNPHNTYFRKGGSGNVLFKKGPNANNTDDKGKIFKPQQNQEKQFKRTIEK